MLKIECHYTLTEKLFEFLNANNYTVKVVFYGSDNLHDIIYFEVNK